MEYFGPISLVPVIIALSLAFWRKNVFLALLSGIFSASVLIIAKDGSVFSGFDAVASVFTSVQTAKTTFFLLLTGALVFVVEASGGAEGLIHLLTEKSKVVKTKTGAQLISFILGLLIFVDATSSIVITALIGKPFFTKYQLPNEKLALISNSTGSPVAWIVPIGGGCAFLASTLGRIIEGTEINQQAFTIVFSSVKYQFYGIILMLFVALSIVLKFEIGPLKSLAITTEKKDAFMMFKNELPKGKKPLARNMIVPLATLIVMVLTILLYTGFGNIIAGDGATAVFTGGAVTLIVTAVFYIAQGITTIDGFIKWCILGMKNLFEIIMILVFAFAFGDLIAEIGTASFLAGFTQYIPVSILLVMVLILSSIIAFSTGSSGATVVLLLPIVVPIAVDALIPLPYVLGAVVSGAVFGDQTSPISDSVILTSTVTGVKIMDHVKTQLPYAVISLLITSVLFIGLGFFV